MKNLFCIKTFQIVMARLVFAHTELPKPAAPEHDVDAQEKANKGVDKSVDLNNAENYKKDAEEQLKKIESYSETLKSIGQDLPQDLQIATNMMRTNLGALTLSERNKNDTLKTTAMQMIDKAFDMLKGYEFAHKLDSLNGLFLVTRSYKEPVQDIYEAIEKGKPDELLKPSATTKEAVDKNLEALFNSALKKIGQPDESTTIEVDGKMVNPFMKLDQPEINALKAMCFKAKHYEGKVDGRPYILDVAAGNNYLRLQIAREHEVNVAHDQNFLKDKQFSGLYFFDLWKGESVEKAKTSFATLTETEKEEKALESNKESFNKALESLNKAPFGTRLSVTTQENGTSITRVIRKEIDGKYQVATAKLDESGNNKITGKQTDLDFNAVSKLLDLASAKNEKHEISSPKPEELESMVKNYFKSSAEAIATNHFLFKGTPDGRKKIEERTAALYELSKQYSLDKLAGNWQTETVSVVPAVVKLEKENDKFVLAIMQKQIPNVPDTSTVVALGGEKSAPKMAPELAPEPGKKPVEAGPVRVASYEIKPASGANASS